MAISGQCKLMVSSSVWISDTGMTNEGQISQVTSVQESPAEQPVWKKSLRAPTSQLPLQLFCGSQLGSGIARCHSNGKMTHLTFGSTSWASSWPAWVPAGLRRPPSLHRSTGWMLAMLHIVAASPLSSFYKKPSQDRLAPPHPLKNCSLVLAVSEKHFPNPNNTSYFCSDRSL